MRKDEISKEFTALAFDFFYWFSRFEFCLKENGYLKHGEPGDNAEPGWGKFVDEHSGSYQLSADAQTLLNEPPERQVVAANRALEWRPVGMSDCTSDLAKAVRLIKTVRNNLFHGGKHRAASWDDPARAQSLLTASRGVLEELAVLGAFQDDYQRLY